MAGIHIAEALNIPYFRGMRISRLQSFRDMSSADLVRLSRFDPSQRSPCRESMPFFRLYPVLARYSV
jgi:hypothetical protein